MKTLVPLGLLVLSAAAVEPHVDWSQDGLVAEDVTRKREAEPNEIHVDWSQGGVIVEDNKKREAIPNEVHVDWYQNGVVVEAEKVKRAAGTAAPSTLSDTQGTEKHTHKHGGPSKSKPTGKSGDGHGHGGGQGGGHGGSHGGSHGGGNGSEHGGGGSHPKQQNAQDGGAAITVITDPRSGGAAQTITAQSQRATMFIPTLTYCGGQGSAEQTAAATSEGGAASNSDGALPSAAASTGTGSIDQSADLQQRDTKAKAKKKHANKVHKLAAHASGAPHKHRNATTAASAAATGDVGVGSGNGSGCRTLYRSTVTPVCHTTLRGDGMGAVVVNDCDQQVTFRMESSVNSTTEYIAKWDQIQQDHVPTGTVTVRQCQAESCTSSLEQWQEASTAAVETQKVPVRFNEEVTGPATMNYGNQTVTVAAGQTSRVAIHTQIFETQAGQQAYIERRPLSQAQGSTDSGPATPTAAPTAAADPTDSPSDSNESNTQPEITTTITQYSSTTITVTDWASSDTAGAAASTNAVAPDSFIGASPTDDSNPPAASNSALASGSDSASAANPDANPSDTAAPSNNFTPIGTSISESAGTTDPIETFTPTPTEVVSNSATAFPPTPSSFSESSEASSSTASEPFDSWSRSGHPTFTNTNTVQATTQPNIGPSEPVTDSGSAATPDFTGLPIGIPKNETGR